MESSRKRARTGSPNDPDASASGVQNSDHLPVVCGAIRCGLCGENPAIRPQVGRCGHTFCRACLAEVVAGATALRILPPSSPLRRQEDSIGVSGRTNKEFSAHAVMQHAVLAEHPSVLLTSSSGYSLKLKQQKQHQDQHQHQKLPEQQQDKQQEQQQQQPGNLAATAQQEKYDHGSCGFCQDEIIPRNAHVENDDPVTAVFTVLCAHSSTAVDILVGQELQQMRRGEIYRRLALERTHSNREGFLRVQWVLHQLGSPHPRTCWEQQDQQRALISSLTSVWDAATRRLVELQLAFFNTAGERRAYLDAIGLRVEWIGDSLTRPQLHLVMDNFGIRRLPFGDDADEDIARIARSFYHFGGPSGDTTRRACLLWCWSGLAHPHLEAPIPSDTEANSASRSQPAESAAVPTGTYSEVSSASTMNRSASNVNCCRSLENLPVDVVHLICKHLASVPRQAQEGEIMFSARVLFFAQTSTMADKREAIAPENVTAISDGKAFVIFDSFSPCGATIAIKPHGIPSEEAYEAATYVDDGNSRGADITDDILSQVVPPPLQRLQNRLKHSRHDVQQAQQSGTWKQQQQQQQENGECSSSLLALLETGSRLFRVLATQDTVFVKFPPQRPEIGNSHSGARFETRVDGSDAAFGSSSTSPATSSLAAGAYIDLAVACAANTQHCLMDAVTSLRLYVASEQDAHELLSAVHDAELHLEMHGGQVRLPGVKRKSECRFGVNCYRVNPLHRAAFYHPRKNEAPPGHG